MNSNNNNDDMSLSERLVHSIRSGDDGEATKILQEIDSCHLINPISGRTLLHEAADTNNVTITRYLIDRGCNVDAADNCGDTPLILACQKNYRCIAKVLIEAKASVLICNNAGKNAAEIVLGGAQLNIHIIFDPVIERVKEECSNDSLQTAKELIRIGCSLTRAMRLRDVEITRYMLDSGCNVNDQDHQFQDWTPLHQALVFKDTENAKLLIDRGADANVEDVNGVTAVSHAYDCEILEMLLEKGAKVVNDDGTLIADRLFCRGEKEVVEMLIERYNLADLSIRDRNGTTLFHHLSENLFFDPVEILQKHFKYPLDINQKDSEGLTALIRAVVACNVRTVEFLLKMGAESIAKDVWDSEVYFTVFPIYFKDCEKDRKKILMLLLQYGADIQWMTDSNRDGTVDTVLDLALRYQYFAIVKIILARLALVEDLGVGIKNLYRERIENNAMCKKYFEFCKRTIEKLKRAVIQRRVTLFDFLTCSEGTLVKFAHSEELVAKVQSIMYHKRHSNLYYYKVLRRRAKKAVETVDLRKGTSLYMNHLIPELQSNQIVIEKIVEYIVYDMLGAMARDPTFKCVMDNE